MNFFTAVWMDIFFGRFKNEGVLSGVPRHEFT